MINLFEYKNKAVLGEDLSGIEDFLDEIWKNREKSPSYFDNESFESSNQGFINFLRKSNEIKSNKYVGVIHYQGQKINLLPKIFYDGDREYPTSEVHQIHNHILWWLSYCRKIKFPNYHSSLGDAKSDFLEVLIYLFSKFTRELFNSSLYQQYVEVTNELHFVKGRLNTTNYINDNISKGRWHKLNCTYDSFELDNEFNRIIKYVTTLLFNVTSSQENKKNLREILFFLDEVTDERATVEQCSRIAFNPMFGEFETVRDYCELFLSNCVSFDYKNDLKLFAFLLPMEYVFEDFIFGFIEKEIPEITAKSQRSDTYLDESRAFSIKPDLWINTPSKSLIADTKYKIVYSDEADPKKGISQADLYQMLAYAVRFNVDDIVLFYPNTIIDNQQKKVSIIIKDALANNKEVSIRAYQLPVLSREVLLNKYNPNKDFAELFGPLKNELSGRIRDILIP
jgi:5-methylcytosine-specific restriction enzyme subunit McrC